MKAMTLQSSQVLWEVFSVMYFLMKQVFCSLRESKVSKDLTN